MATTRIPKNGIVEYGLAEADGKFNVRATAPNGFGELYRNLTLEDCKHTIGQCVMSLEYNFGTPVPVKRMPRPFLL